MQNKKLRHITDNVHDTVYLSEFESIMMSTPFFYRLHDVYQSSTVYMTLPCNRTKRYEHSIGTMHLASKIFSSAISNSSQEDNKKFLIELDTIAKEIFLNLKSRDTVGIPYLCETTKKIVETACPEDLYSNKSEIETLCNLNLESIRDIALNQFINSISISNENDIKYIFLYQCILQAIRIAALFHDIGHPPYSHIIEDVFSVLYNNSKIAIKKSKEEENNHNEEKLFYNKNKAEGLVKILNPYFEEQKEYNFLLKKTDESFPQNEKIAFHEKVGLRMLVSTLKYSLTEIFYKLGCIGKKLTKEQKEGIIYYILVSEFVFGILDEKRPLFKTLHRIIDGPIDADRLDYIVRDTGNSGIDWGHIPYERIIRSVKLICAPNTQNFFIAFPEKLIDDLDDVIVARYKIYSRINAHHRIVKTSKLLQIAVRQLAEDYLKKEGEESCLSGDIAHLWLALKDSLTDDVANRKISKWNDSWLISVLNSALVKVCEEDCQENGNIRNILEEILLNQKKYYSLIKRQHDARDMAQQILVEAGLTEQKLSEIIMREYSKLGEYIENRNAQKEFISKASIDSLNRIQLLKNCINKADFEMLAIIIPFEEESVYNIIKNILNNIKKSGKINGYIIEKNKTRENLGITDSEKDAIYLYSSDNLGPKLYDKDCVLAGRLKSLREANLWLHAYIEPSECEGNNIEIILKEIREQIVKSIGQSIKNQFQLLFPNVALQ